VKNQRERILELLKNRQGEWVARPAILALGVAQYNSRLLDLRREGYIIENRIEKRDGVIHSWYRLVEAKPEQLTLGLPGKQKYTNVMD
jgi:hypothetical protein